MDTVPPYIPPAYDGIKVTGRGANDAKGCDVTFFFLSHPLMFSFSLSLSGIYFSRAETQLKTAKWNRFQTLKFNIRTF